MRPRGVDASFPGPGFFPSMEVRVVEIDGEVTITACEERDGDQCTRETIELEGVLYDEESSGRPEVRAWIDGGNPGDAYHLSSRKSKRLLKSLRPIVDEGVATRSNVRKK